jgi:hypothetical protein
LGLNDTYILLMMHSLFSIRDTSYPPYQSLSYLPGLHDDCSIYLRAHSSSHPYSTLGHPPDLPHPGSNHLLMHSPMARRHWRFQELIGFLYLTAFSGLRRLGRSWYGIKTRTGTSSDKSIQLAIGLFYLYCFMSPHSLRSPLPLSEEKEVYFSFASPEQ